MTESIEMKVLLVEDDSGDASLIRHYLLSPGKVRFNMDWVQNMRDARDYLAQSETLPNVILLDLSLPDSHGLETVRIARGIAGEVPIIVLTGHDDDGFALETLDAGAHDYLVKGGFDTEILVRAIRYAGQRAHMEARIGLLAAAVEVAAESIVITDPTGRILVVNPAFSEITGYGEDEAVGQRPSMLKSGVHNDEFYRQLWGRLLETGTWQGEMNNRRKNGEVYPQWLSIRAVRDEAGSVLNYVAVATDLSLIRKAEEDLAKAGTTDALTGLRSRTYLLERLDIALIHAQRHQEHGAVVVIDIERFRAINEAEGMEVGDALLRGMGQRLTDNLHKDDCVARLGGDQFAFLALHLSPNRQEAARETMAVVIRLKQILEKELILGDRQYKLELRFGISLFPDIAMEKGSEHLRNATTALSRIKRETYERISFFEVTMGERARERYILENQLRSGISDGQLCLHLQPQVLPGHGVTGFEALVRWQHPQRGLMAPNDFIPVAEESDLIVALDRWVLAESCRQLSQLIRAGYHASISVNVSPRFFAHKDFIAMVRSALSHAEADPSQLILEVTERLFIADIEQAALKMHALAELGVRFSIDDFGTGYSSLAYLKRLPVNELKIDRGFIRDLPEDRDNAILVETILSVASHMGLSAVAEGVETPEQVSFLSRHATVVQQGYVHGRPQAITTWLSDKERYKK